MKPILSVHLVTWNSRPFIERWLESMHAQTVRDLALIIVDNASTDGTPEWIERHAPDVTLIRNSENTGFAHAHNQAFEASEFPFNLIINPDVILASDFCSIVLRAFDDPMIGSAGGKVMRIETWPTSITSVTATVIDSTGMLRRPWRQVIDRGSGKRDRGQFDDQRTVFGMTGACCMYRRASLEEVRTAGEIYDDQFGSYKEDVDLAWRLQNNGWTARYCPEAVAYHRRVVSNREPFVARMRQRSKDIAIRSLTNHAFTIIKNDRGIGAVVALPMTIIYEFAKWTIMLVVRPTVWASAVKRFCLLGSRMVSKRRKAVVASSRP